MAREKGSRSSERNLWKGSDLDLGRIEETVRFMRHSLSSLERSVMREDTNLDLDYNTLFNCVEELYSLLGIDKLSQDNARRYKMHKKKVRQ